MNVSPDKRVLSAALCLVLTAVTIPIETGAVLLNQDPQAAPAPAWDVAVRRRPAPVTFPCAKVRLVQRISVPRLPRQTQSMFQSPEPPLEKARGKPGCGRPGWQDCSYVTLPGW